MFTAHPTLAIALPLLGLTPGAPCDVLAWGLAIVWQRRQMWRSAAEETAVVAMALCFARGDRRGAEHWALYIVDEARAVSRAAGVEAAAEGTTVVQEWEPAVIAEAPVPTEPVRRPARPVPPPAPVPAPAPNAARRPRRGKDFTRANDRLDARIQATAPAEWDRITAWRSVAGKGIERCSDVACLCGYPKTLCRSLVASQRAVA